MRFQGRHGVERPSSSTPQPFEVDVELVLDLAAGRPVDDDLARTVDYGKVFDVVRDVVESTEFRLIEALAEAIAHELLATFRVDEVVVRVRKLEPPIVGTLGWAGVEVVRTRAERR